MPIGPVGQSGRLGMGRQSGGPPRRRETLGALKFFIRYCEEASARRFRGLRPGAVPTVVIAQCATRTTETRPSLAIHTLVLPVSPCRHDPLRPRCRSRRPPSCHAARQWGRVRLRFVRRLRVVSRLARRKPAAIWRGTLDLSPDAEPCSPRPHTVGRRRARLSRTHRRHSGFVDVRARRTGRVFRGRFGSAPMDEAHQFVAARRIALNPVRARTPISPDATIPTK